MIEFPSKTRRRTKTIIRPSVNDQKGEEQKSLKRFDMASYSMFPRDLFKYNFVAERDMHRRRERNVVDYIFVDYDSFFRVPNIPATV